MSRKRSNKPRNNSNNQTKTSNLYNFQAKTENQKLFLRSICENIVTIGYGYAGTGKSMCSIGIACQKLKQGIIKNVIITKPIIGCGHDIGSLPGTISERIHPYMMPIYEYLEFFLGKMNCLSFIGNTINLFPIELVRGHTYHDSIMILDEAQNCTPKQIKLFMSRIGQNSKIVIIGDNKQSDIGDNGLQFCVDNFKPMRNINIVEFTKYDVLRNNIIPNIIEVFDSKGI